MKRFFCTICQKTKRVRTLPNKIENGSLLDPNKRLGKCNFHSSDSHSSYLNQINPRVRKIRVKPVKVVAESNKRVRRSA